MTTFELRDYLIKIFKEHQGNDFASWYKCAEEIQRLIEISKIKGCYEELVRNDDYDSERSEFLLSEIRNLEGK